MAPKKAKTTATAKPDEPAAKKAKVEEPKKEAAPKAPEPKKDEPAKEMEVEKPAEKEPEPEEVEKETDDKPDNRPVLKEPIGFDPSDMTLNVVPTVGGKVLMSLNEGGMQYFIAGARANLGMKAGRYMFEVKVVQTLNPDQVKTSNSSPKPRNLIRIGFSTSKASLILGDSEESVCFDGEGMYMEGSKKSLAMKKATPGVNSRITKGAIMAVLLNLDAKSDNKNTISLFKDGVRVSDPKPLPEALQGKTLYPHVSYRCVSVQLNFGTTAISSLPFKCRTLGAAANSDTAKVKSSVPKDGKYEILVPVAFPDEGTFEWADSYLEKNPKFVELSDRKILEWAKKSGCLWKPTAKIGPCNDKPLPNSGIHLIDDFSVRKVINAVAPTIPRNYLIMEVKSNLLAEDRKALLKRFNYPHYTKVAAVVMGEPSDDFKSRVQTKLLETKQADADKKWKALKAEEKRKKMLEKRKKEQEKAKKKADKARKKAVEERRKMLEEAKKKAEEAKKAKEEAKKEGEEKKEEKPDEEKKEEKPPEEKKEEKPEEEKKEEKKEEEDSDEEEEKDDPMEEEEGEPPTVELTEEEKKMWFVPTGSVTDLTTNVLNKEFGKFTTPEEDEGFDEIRYEWQKKAKAKDYLKTWVQEKKLTSRIDDLVPGKASKERLAAFKKTIAEWQDKQRIFKASGKKVEKKKKDKDDKEVEEPAVDIYSIEDVCDIGGGVPLFEKFEWQDWVLCQTRFEFYHLVRSFKEDTQDADRLGIHEDHILFYFTKYHSKALNPKPFAVDDLAALIALLKDTVSLDSVKKVMTSPLEDDLDNVDIFVKLTEETRRERQRRIDAGDETARLKFSDSLKGSIPAPKGSAATQAPASKTAPAPKKK